MADVTITKLDGQWGYIIRSDARSAITMYYRGWLFAVAKERDKELRLIACKSDKDPRKSYAYGEDLAKRIKLSYESDKPFKDRVMHDPATILLIDMAGQLLCPEYMTKGANVRTFDSHQYIIEHNDLTAVAFYAGDSVSALVQIVDDKPVVMCSRPFIGRLYEDDEYRIAMKDRAIKAFATGKEIKKELDAGRECNQSIENAAMKFMEENYG